MTTIEDIRDSLVEVFEGLRNGTMEPKQAVEINNTAGKIINTAKVQIAYSALRGEQPNIPFLNIRGGVKAKRLIGDKLDKQSKLITAK